MDEDDDLLSGEPEIIEASPWVHHDTVASAMVFAAQLSNAAGQHFMNLAMLAMGQSGMDLEEITRQKFVLETFEDINRLSEGGDDAERGSKDSE